MSFRRALAVLALPSLLFGCDAIDLNLEPEVDLTPPPRDEHLPPASVNLPTVPPLELLDTPPHLPDGSWSVAGLLLNRDDLREREVRVTAIVSSIYQCESDAVEVEGEAAELAGDRDDGPEAVLTGDRAGCLMPNFRIVDTLRSPHEMLMVDYDAEFYEPQLRAGSSYVFTGIYTRQAPGFTSTEYGLIRVTHIEGDGIEHPEDEEEAVEE